MRMSKYQSEFRLTEQSIVSRIVSKPSPKLVSAEIKPCVLMVGMHLTKTRGGISTLINEILKSPLKDEFEFVYIESQAEDFGRFGKAFLALQAILRFVFNCLWLRPKVVYVHLGSNASLYRESVFILLAKIFRKRVIAHFHAGDIDNYYPFQSKIGQNFIRRAIRSSDKIIAVSEESARQLRNITDSANISVIPNAIDTSVFKVCKRSSKTNQSDEVVRLLFVGAIGKLKGEKDLIKALEILSDRKPNIKVSFLGYGAESLMSYCNELKVSNFIEFLGAVSLDERIDFFQKADVFVLPTYAEAMPMSVIEAMAAGLPVISTTVGGIPELITDGVDGLLYSPGDVNALADKISFLLDNKNIRNEIGKKAGEKAAQEMDFKQYTDKLRFHLTASETIKNMTNTKLLIKRSIKSAASVAKAKTGFAKIAPGSVNIIAYHRVVADIAKAERDAIYGLSVSSATFRRHCELLRKSFDVVSLETARHFLDGERRVVRPLAVITFDDGYLDFYEEAFPVLNEFGLPATVFLPTEFIGKNKPLAHDRLYWLVKQAIEKSVPVSGALLEAGVSKELAATFSGGKDILKLTDSLVFLPGELRERVILRLEQKIGDKFEDYPSEYRLLNWEMIREMRRKGISFGGHTASHVVLPLEDDSAMERELVASKKELETQLSEKVFSFAYPNGGYNQKIKKLVAEAGYKIAVTTEKRINRPSSDLLALGRISLCEESTRGVKGTYSPRVADLRLGI